MTALYENWAAINNGFDRRSVEARSPTTTKVLCPCCRSWSRTKVKLACVHWLCRRCTSAATKALTATATISGGSRRRRGALLCPFCHEITTLVLRSKNGFYSPIVPCWSNKETCIDDLRLALGDLGRRRSAIAAAAADAERARVQLAAEVAKHQEVTREEEDWEEGEGRRRQRIAEMSRLLWRLCLLRQCEEDLDQLVKAAATAFTSESANAQNDILPRLSIGLDAVGNALNRLEVRPQIKKNPLSSILVCLDLSAPLYEKVLCSVPASVIGHTASNLDFFLSLNGIPVPQTDIELITDLSEEDHEDEKCLETRQQRWTRLLFVPPFAGRATLTGHASSAKTANASVVVVVFPSSFSVRPLSLENGENGIDKGELFAL